MSKAELALPFQECGRARAPSALYRAGRPAAQAVAELKRCVGTQFDPRVVEALAGAIGADRRVETRAA